MPDDIRVNRECLDGLQARVDELTAENAKLREALRPLANAYQSWQHESEESQVSIPLGLLRRAAEALEEEPN